MFVPRTKLIGSVCLTLVPIAAIASGWGPAVLVAWILVGALAGFVLLDAALARSRIKGVRVFLPELVRMQKDRPASIEVRVQNESRQQRFLKIGLPFPAVIEVKEEVREISAPAGAENSQIEWTCTPRERGRFTIDQVFIEIGSPFGFWGWRSPQAVHSELRVYPNLHAERRQVAAIFLRRKPVGAHAQRSAGQGREFEKLREYLPGDSLGDVHWKAAAKRRQLVTKVHQIERSHEVYIIIDTSRLSARIIGKGRTDTALERFVTAAMILGAAAEQQGDQFGIITFSDRVQTFMRARAGQAHFAACRDRLYALQPQSVTPDFEELCSFLKLRLRRRALLIFLTALDDPFLASSFVTSSELLARQHLLLVNTLQSGNIRPIFADPDVAKFDDLYQNLGGHLQWQRTRELEKVLRRRGIRFSALDPDYITADLVRQHAEVRARELV